MAHRTKRKAVAGLATSLAAAILALAVPAVSVGASYNRSAAASYAETYWRNYNPVYPSFSNDCQNFVSQSVNAGNYNFDGWLQSQTDDRNWWIAPSIWSWTLSWTVVTDYRNFLVYDLPGGYLWYSYHGNQYGYQSGVQTADVLIYSWTGSSLDHSTLQVLTGNYTDPNSGWIGDEIDSHTSNRQHAYWALTPYNSQSSTTYIYAWHIDNGND